MTGNPGLWAQRQNASGVHGDSFWWPHRGNRVSGKFQGGFLAHRFTGVSLLSFVYGWDLLWLNIFLFMSINADLPEISFRRRVALLANLSGFSALPMNVHADLAASLTVEQFSVGAVVVAERQIGDRMYVIENGVAEVSTTATSGTVSLGEIATGEMFGEIALVSKIKRRKATVIALTPLVTLSLSVVAFEKIMSAYPEVLTKFIAAAEVLINHSHPIGMAR